MNTRGLTRHPLSILLIACAVFSMLLSACQPVTVTTSLPPAQPVVTTLPALPPTAAPAPTDKPVAQPTPVPPSSSGQITLDLSGVAQDQTVETVAAVSADAGGPFWEVLPQYQRVTLQGYPVPAHMLKPQTFIFPVSGLASANEGAGKMASDLQTLLQNQKVGDHLPFLPLFNASQVMHAQVKFIDFKNGKGVRFLTQFDQGPMPINDYELFYTFQGLTSDGKYYIAAVLPVTHPELPASQQVNDQQQAELNDFPAYLTKTVAFLNDQLEANFTPDLAQLDSMIQSIEIK
jgi:hypothetical protein